MRAIGSIFSDSLDSFSYEDILQILQGIGAEGQLVDFKEAVDSKRKLAFCACGFANALGGIIAIGIKDPKRAGDRIAAGDLEVDISDEALTGISSTIQSLVYPGLACELRGYTSGAFPQKHLLIIRVPQSGLAPHEYMGKDEKVNLPVRRDREFRALTLPELAALTTRSEGRVVPSPLGQRHPMLSISRTLSEPEYFLGIHIWPTQYAAQRRVLTASDDAAIQQVVRKAINCSDMTHKVHADGLLFENEAALNASSNEARRAIYIMSDGDVTLRSVETQSTRVYQICELLANGYAIVSQLNRYLLLTPRVRAQLEMKLDANYKPYANELAFPSDYSDVFSFDVSTDAFPDIALDTLLRCLRTAGHSYERDSVRQIAEGLWQRGFSNVIDGDLRDRWV